MKGLHLVVGFALFASAGVAFADNPPSTQTPAPTTTTTTTDTSQPPPATQPTPPAATEPDPNEKICKESATTGSRLPSKICKTRKEWEEDAKSPGSSADF